MSNLHEWKFGAPILIAAMVCNAFSVIPVNVLGPLIHPLELAFGWSRAAISSAVLITAIGTIFIAPVAGRIIDLVGPRRMALISLPLLGFASALIGLAGPSIISWYACWAVYGVIQACAGYIIWTKGIVSRFDGNRGMALSIMLSGAALANGFLPTLAEHVVAGWSWRGVYFLFGAGTLLIGWPLAWQYFYGAYDLERRDARSNRAAASGASLDPNINIVVRQALRSVRYWQMAISFFIAGSAVAALFVHLIPALVAAGLSSHAAATVAIVLGPAAVAGRLGAGYFLDRFPPNHVVALAFVLPSISFGIMLFGGTSLSALYLCALLLGVVLGAEGDFMAYLASRYFGQQAFGSLFGILLGVFAVGYGLGPYIAGGIFDATKSYRLSFILFGCAVLVGAFLIERLGAAPPIRHANALPPDALSVEP